MKYFLALVICLVALTGSAQDTQIRKGGGGAGGSATNAVTVVSKDGVPIVTGATLIDFTNAAGTVVTVSANGATARIGIPQSGVLPSFVITNNNETAITLLNNLTSSNFFVRDITATNIGVSGALTAASITGTGDMSIQGSVIGFPNASFTANRVLYLDIGKHLATSPNVTATELEYLDGVTSAIQPQIDALVGGGGTPGGTTPMIQMNMGGAFVGTTNLWYDNTNNRLSLIASANIPQLIVGRTNGVAGFTNTLFGAGADWQYISLATDPNINFTMGNSTAGLFGYNLYTNRIIAQKSNATDIGSVIFPFRDLYASSNINAQTIVLSSTAPGELTLRATNTLPYILRAANSNAVSVTNIVGLIQKANAVYQPMDCNFGNEFQVTNRIAQNTVVDWQNLAQGQEVSLRVSGAASGGTDFYITNIFPTSWMVADQSTNASVFGTTLTMFVGAGKGVELNIKAYKFLSVTNVAGAVYSTYKE